MKYVLHELTHLIELSSIYIKYRGIIQNRQTIYKLRYEVDAAVQTVAAFYLFSEQIIDRVHFWKFFRNVHYEVVGFKCRFVRPTWLKDEIYAKKVTLKNYKRNKKTLYKKHKLREPVRKRLNSLLSSHSLLSVIYHFHQNQPPYNIFFFFIFSYWSLPFTWET